MIAPLARPTVAIDAVKADARRLHAVYVERFRACPCGLGGRLCHACQEALHAADAAGNRVLLAEGRAL